MIKLFLFYLFTALYYNSYRYILKINNARTSPTYSDTPSWLSGGKYIIILFIFCLILSLLAMRKKKNNYSNNPTVFNAKNKKHATYVMFFLAFYAYAFVVTGITGDFYALESTFFFPIFIFILLGDFDRHAFFNKVFSFLKASVWIFFIVDIIQYLLFYFFNRLPALAYEGSVSVRFGSLQDDPNGYAFLMSSFYFVGMYYRGFTRTMFYLLFAINLLLTISFTGMAAVLLSIAIVTLLSAKLTFNKLIVYWSSLVVAVAGVIVISQLPLVQKIISTKQGSIDQHANLFSALTGIGVSDVFGFNPVGWLAESAYVNILLNFGVIVTCVVYFIIASILYSFVRYLTKVKPDYNRLKKEPVYILGLCAFSFSFSIFIGGVNLPLEVVFPVNALFPFFLSLLCIIPGYRYALDNSYQSE